MMFRASGPVPPIVLSSDPSPIATPIPFAKAVVPVTSVPIRLFWIRLPRVSMPGMPLWPQVLIPAKSQPEITFRAAGVVPPMVLLDDWAISMP